MNPEEYDAAQLVIVQQMISSTLQLGSLITRPALSTKDWLSLLQTLFPQVQIHRDASARLARQFYDAQRHQTYPSLPVNLRPLEGTSWPEFVSNMEPARARLSQEDSPQHAVNTLALRTAREVGNAGRQQIIHAVDNDPAIDEIHGSVAKKDESPKAASALQNESTGRPPLALVKTPQQDAQDQHGANQSTDLIRGWARVATGRETCAWCLMLVSRGPVYRSAENAGLDLDNLNAVNLTAAGADVSGDMQEWHDGCDCIVVPVFKQSSWTGQAAQERAEQLWIEATKTADAEMESNPGKVFTAGKNKGQIVSRSQRAINALRRQLSTGAISPQEFAGLSLAS